MLEDAISEKRAEWNARKNAENGAVNETWRYCECLCYYHSFNIVVYNTEDTIFWSNIIVQMLETFDCISLLSQHRFYKC